MRATGFALFDTALGPCGVAWGARGIVAMQLPEAQAGHLRTRLRQAHPGATETTPPPDVQRAMERVAALLRGEAVDLSDVPLDMEGIPEFNRRVYALTQRIPPGQTLTYGEVAERLGEPGSARAVGQALGRNPFAPIVPCHRVLAAGGRPGGFSARGGVETKLRLLAIENARLGDGPDLFDTTGA
ncbi:MAG TPA: methylated-DNA--[protein]-cysteine S-methyltransferase [Albitalea sp.]|nr:methylated-DNA--[protein]-cysteine S-methyltransferase [Albitalea sp.]